MPASHADPYGHVSVHSSGAFQSSLLIESFTESMNLLEPASSATNQIGMLR